MSSMVYTKTNRYKISNSDLEIYFSYLKSNAVLLSPSGYNDKYYTDGYHYYKVVDFKKMLSGELFPFPETVSLILKKKYLPRDITSMNAELTSILSSPIKRDYIFD